MLVVTAVDAAQALRAQDLLVQVEKANPTLSAAQARVRAASAEVRRAFVPEDPTLTFSARQVPTDPRMWMAPRDALAQPMLMAQAGWMVPITGMPAVRGRMAQAMLDMSRADERMVRVALRRAALVTFWELWLNRQAQELNLQAQSTLQAAEEVALAQYGAGRGSHHGLLRLQAEREVARSEALGLAQTGTALVALLNALRATPGAPVGALDAAPTGRTNVDVTVLLAAAEDARPDLLMARAQARLADAQQTMAWRSLLPEPMVMVMAESRPGYVPAMAGGPPVPETPMLGAGVSFPIPAFAPWRQVQEARAAQSRGRAAQEDLKAARLNLLAQIETLNARVKTLEQREDLLVGALEPRAREAQDATLAALGSGGASALEFLEVRRQLQSIALELANTRAEREVALADLEAAVGVPLASLPGRQP